MFLRLLLIYFLLLPSFALAVPAQSSEIMISAPSPYAVEVGKAIAKAGGNVVDVAVGVGLSLAVTNPYFAALGGGGFALVKMNSAVDVLDFRETAPKASHKDFYLTKAPNASTQGGAAVGVPGFPAGLWALHQKYGKLKWKKLFEKPIEMAEDGFEVTGEWSESVQENLAAFDSQGKKHFLKEDGSLYKPGNILIQPGLAKALKKFRANNIEGFYQGGVAQDIVDSVKANGGILNLMDLETYRVRWLSPIVEQFNNYKIYLMPPPSSGGVVIKSAFELAKRLNAEKTSPLSVDELHLLGEVLSRAFRGRLLLGDPDFHKNPLDQLLSEKYFDEMAKSISIKKATALKPLTDQTKESSQTTHFSVIDKQGHAVSLTVTLNGNFGSGVVSKNFGIALNNEMDDFTTKPGQPNMFGLVQGPGNVVEPGKRPLSSMSPTLVEKDGKIIMALGAPGGPRIISSVFQVLYRVLVNNWDLDQAVQAPRVHHQFLPNKLFVDRDRFSPEVLAALKNRGHEVESSWLGRVYAVRIKPDGILEGAFDARGEGAVGGY